MFKDGIKAVLKKAAYQKYKKALAEQRIEYDGWQRAREKAAEVQEEIAQIEAKTAAQEQTSEQMESSAEATAQAQTTAQAAAVAQVQAAAQGQSSAQAESADAKEAFTVYRVFYQGIPQFLKSARIQNARDEDVFLFLSEEGELAGNAESELRAFFAEEDRKAETEAEKKERTAAAEAEKEKKTAETETAYKKLRLVYADEDEIGADGKYTEPYLRPDWSPDTYLSAFYIGSLFAVRADALRELTESAEDVLSVLYAHAGKSTDTVNTQTAASFISGDTDVSSADLLFACLALREGGFAKREGESFPVAHLPLTLFHRKRGVDIFYGRGHESGILLPNDFLSLLGETGFTALAVGTMQALSAGKPLVSVIIPSKDHAPVLERCVKTLTETKADDGLLYEIIVVDNGSIGKNRILVADILSKLPRIRGLLDVRYVYQSMEFNFSAMCNLGAKNAAGKYLLFLNDDIEAREDFLSRMTYLASLPRVGAVGAKLLYPDGDLIQHAGVTNVRLGPVHKLRQLSDAESYYFGFNRGVHDLLGVPGTCLMLAGDRLKEAGGFPEELPVAFNDVDLCYRLFEAGYYNVEDNRVALLHHESLSRGLDSEDAAKIKRMAGEHDILMDRHPAMYNRDPFYHPHLIEDEHTNVFIFYEDALPAENIQASVPTMNTSGFAEAVTDACLRIGVEYAGALEEWLSGVRDGERADGYYVKGYSFVIGADNACYARKLLLRRVMENGLVDVHVYEVPVEDWYRPDIRQATEDQIHTEMTGFKARIPKGALPAGDYQLGIYAADRTSRQRLVNWVPNLLILP